MGCSKISIGALDIFNGGVKKIQWRYRKGSMGGLKKSGVGSMGALVRVNGGHWSGSMVALKRVNGGIGQGQWGALVRVNGGIEKGQWGRWSGSMGVLKRVNGGIEKGQWGHWSGSMGGIGQGQWWH